MRIAFVTHLLWERYGDFWTHLFQEVDAELLFASKERTLEYFEDERIGDISTVSFRLAAAQSLALANADILLVPELNEYSNATKGAAQDPWIANFPESLVSTIAGLPSILAVPVSENQELESLVLETLMNVVRDPMRARRAWDRHKGRLKTRRKPEPRWQKRASEDKVVAVLAQPWLKTKAFVSAPEKTHMVFQDDLNPGNLAAEGKRFDAKLAPTDQEVIGAARLMSRRGTVDELLFIIDKNSGADKWLYERVKKLTHKPAKLAYLQDLISIESLLELS